MLVSERKLICAAVGCAGARSGAEEERAQDGETRGDHGDGGFDHGDGAGDQLLVFGGVDGADYCFISMSLKCMWV